MIENFLGGFIQLILDFVIYIVNILLLPFDLVIDSLFPDISNALSLISDALMLLLLMLVLFLILLVYMVIQLFLLLSILFLNYITITNLGYKNCY